MKDSKIEWTTHTFNPVIGCAKVSPGCANCYAETLMDKRYGRVKWGRGQERVRTSAANWKQPKKWDKEAAKAGERHRVFCASLADWLDYEWPHGARVDLLNLIEATPNLDWLLLTKRPESWSARLHECAYAAPLAARWIGGEAPRNVWVGVSAEDQIRWDERIPELEAIPAVVRFVSAEPLLGPIRMNGHRPDWLIVGGESGPGARPMDHLWVEDLCDQCAGVGTAFFFKQWGGVDKHATGRLLDGRTWDELPDHATYSREFGTDVSRHISSVLGAEREATAAVAGARGGCGGSARAGEQSSSGAQECNVPALRPAAGEASDESAARTAGSQQQAGCAHSSYSGASLADDAAARSGVGGDTKL